MKRTQLGSNKIRILFLILILSISLSACAVGNGPENSLTASEIIDTHSESDPADAQTESSPDNTQSVTDLTVDDVPELLPDVLKLRKKEYEAIPFLETQDQLSEYALWNLLWGRTEFECRLSWDLSYDVTGVALDQACEDAMSYYLFSSYNTWDLFTEDDGDPDSLYGKVKLVYDAPEFDLEARLAAYRYVMKKPPPKDGFSDYEEERMYAKKIHDYVACKVTYDPMGYEPNIPVGQTKYEALQEAYNVLGENQNTAICAGYARAFALICQYAGINCAWVRGNETEESSHAWNVIYPCDGSEPVLVDVTWDDGLSLDMVGQTDVDYSYFYIPLSSEYEHEADENLASFIQYINEAAHNPY